ncbi:bifunctional chitinase/lysozyme [Spiroplasma helicoides]|uniref:Bifunctional chitinase/lysozyme n=1 Tax=Spiroplasma helicoides TaxID=216938 RepID=A0A1B3SKU4_9MOLU|nr:lipoprotein [Spiroplasma helicoides]AOG60554.1 bifunctional chitinase/lysozyme [Spiroplasma helicoides]
MKKLLSTLAALTLIGSSSFSVVSCYSPLFSKGANSNSNNNGSDNGDDGVNVDSQSKALAKRALNQEADKALYTDYSKNNGNNITVHSNDPKVTTLKGKDYLGSKLDGNTKFTPYADAGIVQDVAEYALKQQGLSGAYRQQAIEAIKAQGIENIDYSIGGYIKHVQEQNQSFDGFKLGFMQNASDTGELVPMWNAAPAKMREAAGKLGITAESGQGTEYANWFNERIASWLNDGTLQQDQITVSFGPFANSFWHTAWQNNKTPEELAQVIKNIGNRYKTSKFEFYFAAPYLTANGDYMASQKLLAAALKILVEEDSNYDFSLALVTSTKDGVAVSDDEQAMILGDEASPLYTFTKYLGMNFRLNLVPYLTVADTAAVEAPSINGDWEEKTIEAAVTNTSKVWMNLAKKLLSDESLTGINETNIYQRMGVTPWIGRRAEKAAYNFTQNDAVNLRSWAIKNKLGNLSMFYISRDVPSEFISNNSGNVNDLADQNPLDQNIRSGTLYKQYSYADALSGLVTSKEQEAANVGEAKGVDYAKDIIGGKVKEALDAISKQQGSKGWTTPGQATPNPSGEGNNGEGAIHDPNVPTEIPTGFGSSRFDDVKTANPTRTSYDIAKTSNVNSNYYYSPYVDAGLSQGNDIAGIQGATGLDHLTLAFVQQANAQDDTMELSVAGMSTTGDAYTWWQDKQLWEKMLKPMAESGNLQNVKVAYGGAATGGYYQKNPWDWALTKAGNVDGAVNMLEEGLTKYQKGLYDLAVSKKVKNVQMPKSIDFDIEGPAQFRQQPNEVLAKTLAKMKKADSQWDFSITLPVLPAGLTNEGYNVMDTFIKAYKEAGLSLADLPIINLMLMDYGDPIYQSAMSAGKSNYDLAVEAIESTKKNLSSSINSNFGTTGEDSLLYSKIGATPMIGVNDTIYGVFTVEDAKDLYNYVNEKGLGYIGIWSMNDDRGKDFYSKQGANKSLLTHGLTYLDDYDFSKAFNGKF